ncbi:N-glycosylase/DNA lyase-like [Saccoglossus kowalevskii]|uniref:DNA-(apurinic or apyrimidinic site) lyase n=1 Tax=Saccoglossus kowalevskii TaxID=10224 RepID=A0ABM0GQF4_SACKO|nr:PREDICTED: N-glycosylase/DNA lyase-like [Saccoglossus kowalevskii]
MSGSRWRSIPCKVTDLRLDITLLCGQSFRWKEKQPGLWSGVLKGKVWTLKQTQDELLYQVCEREKTDLHSRKRSSTDAEICKSKRAKLQYGLYTNIATDEKVTKNEISDNSLIHDNILKDYFHLNVDLQDLYQKWSAVDDNFKAVAANFTGIRLLKQDPVENLFSFICSSNNNITRISGMVERMCQKYGEKICEVEGLPYYSFPSVSALASKQTEQQLRELGFGYRAKYISQAAMHIMENYNENWLASLRDVSYKEAHVQLMKLAGVGAKVADCVCLMSLNKYNAIPVDTHVWQIATRDYMKSLRKTKSLTDKVYKQVGDFFRELYGEYAGWAHSVLFSAELRKFQDLKKEPNSRPLLPIECGKTIKKEVTTT